MSGGRARASRILVVDDELQVGRICAHFLPKEGWEAEGVADAESALGRLAGAAGVGIVFLDLKLGRRDGRQVLAEIKRLHPRVEVVMITAHGSTDTAVECMRLGACDFVTKPFRRERVVAAALQAERALELRLKLDRLQSQIQGNHRFANLVGRSEAMRQVGEWIARSAASDSPVLILGESGTGKDLVARTIHYHSWRSRGPFIAVNCAALPEELIESELFGHVKGAFTGAVADTVGIFRAAEGGTVLLDEIVEMPPGAQAKLLRVLQEQRVRPVGASEETPVDVRIVAATNRDVERGIAEGRFREDLYYRLSVVRFRLPPLRDRAQDIPLLVEHFLARLNGRGRRRVEAVAPDAMEALVRHVWSGNVRELENAVERSFVLGRGSTIRRRDLPPEVLRGARAEGIEVRTLAEMERQEARRALELAGGNISQAARLLGITRKRLYRIARTHGLPI